ncbi:MAG: sensor histidine kinase [Gemmatimonadales bacterium]
MQPSSLTFRQRILLIIVLVGAVPTAIAIVGWAMTLKVGNPAAATRAAIEQIGSSGRTLLATVDTTGLTAAERAALDAHAAQLSEALVRSRQADTYAQYYSAGLTITVLVLGALLVYASVRLGGHLSRQLSRPIDELVGWTRHIERHEPLPPDLPQRGAPEFAVLRSALRDMASGLEQGRGRELEAERLRAFREIARRVAHEMKNPLTPIRFATVELDRTATSGQREALDVLRAESRRLEALARDFTDLGRLPEGPESEVDVGELLAELVRTSVPAEVAANVRVEPGVARITGHYDPLRRAFSNLLRNAVEAMNGRGTIDVHVAPRLAGGVRIRLRDHGPGIPAELGDRVFDPYVTTKAEGTGLGLSLVRQTFDAHGGRIRLEPAQGGGAAFVIELPARRG